MGYYGANNEPWWANHGVVRIHPLRVVLKDIREFLKNTNEIVILDVQEFPVGKEKFVFNVTQLSQYFSH